MSQPASVARPTLCLGEALVDLICERPGASLAEAKSFVPHFGGAVANVAVAAGRGGAPVALAGGAGRDEWGQWLRDRLEREGCDVARFHLIAGTRTPLAVVTVGIDGEPRYTIYGDAAATIVHALGDGVREAVAGCVALFLSSNTLVGARERAVTMEAREAALALGRSIVFDPNLRLNRWRSSAAAADCASACVPDALLVRANQPEAALMTGESDVDRAAWRIVEAGARMVVITLGPRGAILRGDRRADVEGVAADVRSTVGAGDVLTGVLLAGLALRDFDPAAVPASLHEAVAAAAAACERWGALD
ncbi:MAG: PfkB family carbohydrate kinase [Actinomycetota bacterium]|nr:PfkB family carbohydrate kinase [Actinomycetota bacterium]